MVIMLLEVFAEGISRTLECVNATISGYVVNTLATEILYKTRP